MKRTSAHRRRNLLKRIRPKTGGRCLYCGTKLDYPKVTVEHLFSKKENVRKDIRNQTTFWACRCCNNSRSSSNPVTFAIVRNSPFLNIIKDLWFATHPSEEELEDFAKFLKEEKFSPQELRELRQEIKADAYDNKKRFFRLIHEYLKCIAPAVK